MSLQVVKCGTRVKTVIGDLKAIVTGICIREVDVRYELSYFQNGKYESVWVNRFEFEIDVQEKQKAGFVNYEAKDDQNNETLLLLN